MAKSLLPKPTSDDEFYPNDRMPSEQVIGDYALRGYQGKTVLVANRRYFAGTLKLDGFIDAHTRDMLKRGWPVAKQFVEQDVMRLEQMAELCDAVRVTPAR